MSTVRRFLFVLLLGLPLVAALYLNRSDFFIARGSDAAVRIYRHGLWSQLLALALCLAAMAVAVFLRKSRLFRRVLAVGPGLMIFTVSLHTISFDWSGIPVFQEHYGIVRTQSLTLDWESEKPLTYEQGPLFIRLKNQRRESVSIIRWFWPWRYWVRPLVTDGWVVREREES